VSFAATALCRDCLALTEGQTERAVRRCLSCGSPRLVQHAEWQSLSIAHIDCDAFYAAVEKRDNPSLIDQPVIIGGGHRGVVSTCCYIARTFGVRSAMPIFKARALCPDAVIIKPNMSKYASIGRQIRAMMLNLSPLVEPLSIDEAFIDLSGTERLHGSVAGQTLAIFARRVEAEIGITVSIGLSYCKFLAKMASDLDKPRGFAVIGQAEAKDFLARQPIGMIWGVGKVGQARLEQLGFHLIGDLQKISAEDALRRIGAEGQRLWRLAQGRDERAVSPQRGAKSISAETTFDEDIGDLARLEQSLFLLSEKVSARLKGQSLAGKSVTLKLKTADFKLRTRARALSAPTQLAMRIFEAGRDLLSKEVDGTAFRLIGIGLSDFAAADLADRGDLVDVEVTKLKAREQAMDQVRARFGKAAIVKGLVFSPQPGSRTAGGSSKATLMAPEDEEE